MNHLTVSEVVRITCGILYATRQDDPGIRELLIDSRRLIQPEHCLFIALVTSRNDGHHYIGELYEKGVRNFLISRMENERYQMPDACFIVVPDTLEAMQQLAAFQRMRFTVPVIGITGSNGKTIVKEWLFQMLCRDYKIVRSPKSYNSQIGVPLSVWKMEAWNTLAIFEAGISKPGEMTKLERIIQPTIGIFTNIGTAHDEHFLEQRQKVEEKLKLFIHSATLVYCADHHLITEVLRSDPAFSGLKTFTWSRNCEADLHLKTIDKSMRSTYITASYQSSEYSFSFPFIDDASIENIMHCWATMIVLGHPASCILHPAAALAPIAMRLELKEAINHCSLINDSYNSDFNSLSIAIDFLEQQTRQRKKTIILSDILQSGRNKEELYQEIAELLLLKKVDRIIGIGRDISKYADKFSMSKIFFEKTEDFLDHFPLSSFQNESILLKGARIFEFEKISSVLQQKAHETVLEINIDALIHNLNYFRAKLNPGTKVMVMVKAFSYGSGSYEIANVLQFYHADYLAVAYADEGVELRKAGIRLPIMVMSPEEHSLDILLKYNLEPEIYNFRILRLLEEAIARNQTSGQEAIRIHIKLDTGMHRLGFTEDELDELIRILLDKSGIHIQSVFSHLAASEDPSEEVFTRRQIRVFNEMSRKITSKFGYPIIRHILNSAGISRFPDAQMDMVRLGIGLYGIGMDEEEQLQLRNVSTLKSVITQIKHISAGDTIGYNRMGKAVKDKIIAIVPVGYADGLNRRLGNGRGSLYIHGEPAPIIGNICMDLTMIDITDLSSSVTAQPVSAREGDEVIIFGEKHPVTELSRQLDTIPYEILTGISRRVKRIYYYE